MGKLLGGNINQLKEIGSSILKEMDRQRLSDEEKKKQEEEQKKKEEEQKQAEEAAAKGAQASKSGLSAEEQRNLDIAAGIIPAPKKETKSTQKGSTQKAAGNGKQTGTKEAEPASGSKTKGRPSNKVLEWEMFASILNGVNEDNYQSDAIRQGFGPASFQGYLERKNNRAPFDFNQAVAQSQKQKNETENIPVTEKMGRGNQEQKSSNSLTYRPDGSLDAASGKKIADAISQKKQEEQKSQIVKSIYDVIREYSKGDVEGTIRNAENAQVLTQRENIPILYDYIRQRYPGQGYRVSEAIIRSAKNYLSRVEKAGVVDRGQQEGYNGNEWTNQLTQSQMERIWNGEGIDRIAGELPEEVQNELSRKGNELLTELTREQKRDLMFLSSGLLSGIDWETRQKILGVLKENEGRISYEDLEGMGVFKPGDLAEGGFKRWLQEHDIGGPANFDKLLSKEYELTQAETSFAELGQEEQRKRRREASSIPWKTRATKELTSRVCRGIEPERMR